MSEAIQLDDYIDEARSETYPPRAAARKSGGSGGDMDDVLKRLGAVESSVSELRVQVSGIAATMATKDDLNELKVQVSGIASTIPHLATQDSLSEVRAIIPHLATSADLNAGIGSLRAEMSAMETRIIKWFIATALTSVGLASGLAFSIAKFVH